LVAYSWISAKLTREATLRREQQEIDELIVGWKQLTTNDRHSSHAAQPGTKTDMITEEVPNEVTFIVPSGRPVLSRALASLQAQTNRNWQAIVVLGLTAPPSYRTRLSAEPPTYIDLPQEQVGDPRIQFLTLPATKLFNHAGAIRNSAFKFVRSRWIAFLDDDDTVSEHCVEIYLQQAKLEPDAAVIIGRMHCETCFASVLPRPSDTDFALNYVGISFAVQRSIVLGGKQHGKQQGTQHVTTYQFEPGCAEDYLLLHQIRVAGHKIVIAPEITVSCCMQQQRATFSLVLSSSALIPLPSV
jgi:hypothetical protein